jgi:Ankyrin repeats (3 copies)
MLTPKAKHIRRGSWIVIGLEVGAALFIAGLLALYLNPFWHFDDGGFLDWRVHWWNAAGEILTASGLLIETLALVGAMALIVSHFAYLRSWPYVAAAVLVCCVLAVIGLAGFTRDVDARFEWDAADGFSVFNFQGLDEPTRIWRWAGSPVWQSIVEIQIQPLLRGYLKVNDWQKMNGDIAIKVVRILPIAWPVALGNGGEILEDPDETPLMRAAAQGDLRATQKLLSTASRADVNALDQSGQTALILACENPKANPEVIKALLAAGADVNLRSRNGYAPLTWASARKNNEVVRLLRRAGARP